jgi:type VI secretion system Hcp family effector
MKKILIPLVLCCLFMNPASTEAAITAMRVEGRTQGVIEGDISGLSPNQDRMIVVLAMGTSMSRSGIVPGGPGSGATEIGPFTVTKNMDRATPGLFKAFITGELLKSVIIRFFRVTTDRDPYFTIELRDAHITEMKTEGNAQVSGGVKESVTFTWDSMRMKDEITHEEVIIDASRI